MYYILYENKKIQTYYCSIFVFLIITYYFSNKYFKSNKIQYFSNENKDYEDLPLDFNINELNINPNKEVLKKRINFITNELKVNPKLTDKTVALCLAGISYKKNHKTLYKKVSINFKIYASNIKFFYKDFKKY